MPMLIRQSSSDALEMRCWLLREHRLTMSYPLDYNILKHHRNAKALHQMTRPSVGCDPTAGDTRCNRQHSALTLCTDATWVSFFERARLLCWFEASFILQFSTYFFVNVIPSSRSLPDLLLHWPSSSGLPQRCPSITSFASPSPSERLRRF
jgi:hypothetical protein